MNRTLQTATLAVFITIIAAGCASTAPVEPAPTGRSITDISNQYKQGTDLVSEGERIKVEADAEIAAASERKTQAQALVKRGKTLMAESEQAFRDKAGKGNQK